MKKLAITTLAVSALAISGCVSTGLATPLSPTQVKALASTCLTIDQLYPTFKALADGGVLSPKLKRQGDYVIAVTRPICATPANATYNDIIVAAAQSAILARILKDST
jgi:outer membrane murein-binding lipoprotein Lpp